MFDALWDRLRARREARRSKTAQRERSDDPSGQRRTSPTPRRLDLRHVARRRGRRTGDVVFQQTIVHTHPSVKSRVLQRTVRLTLKPTLALAPLSDSSLFALKIADLLTARGPRSSNVETVKGQLGGVPVESMTHRFGPPTDLTVLYLHGGGFVSCGIDTHRRICERLSYATGATVHSVAYRQLPEVPIAGSVADAISAYEDLVKQVEHPDKIVVAGDSAGGYLSMKIAELCSLRGLTPPAALVTFSPLLSLDPGAGRDGVVSVAPVRDAYLPVRRLRALRSRWLPESSPIEGADSPLDAIEHITCPVFVVACDDEALRPEAEAMAMLLAERGVEVEVHIWQGQIHAFPVLASLLPESLEAIALAANFARRAVGEDPSSHPSSGDEIDQAVVGRISERPVNSDDDDVLDIEVDRR